MDENVVKILLKDIKHELIKVDNLYVTNVEKECYRLEDLCILPQGKLIKRIDEVMGDG